MNVLDEILSQPPCQVQPWAIIYKVQPIYIGISLQSFDMIDYIYCTVYRSSSNQFIIC